MAHRLACFLCTSVNFAGFRNNTVWTGDLLNRFDFQHGVMTSPTSAPYFGVLLHDHIPMQFGVDALLLDKHLSIQDGSKGILTFT